MKSRTFSLGGAILVSWLASNCLWGATSGSLDLAFTPATRSSDVFWGLAIQADGKILATGRENTTAPIYGLIYRWETNGQADPGFQSGPRASGPEGAIPQINAVSLQADGRIVLGGQFTYFDGLTRGRLAQLTVSGGLDPDFTPAANYYVYTTWIQPDGKILIGGSFRSFNGTGQNYITRLNADGSRDSTFNENLAPDSAVRTIVQQPDGLVLIGGDFVTVNGIACPHIARLATNGSVDLSFGSPGADLDGAVSAIAVQASDQKILVGGSFLNAGGESHIRIARLTPEGTVDSSFTNGCDQTVWALAIQGNGKILAGGRFNNVNGLPRQKLVRFLADGLVDPDFDADAGAGTGSGDEVRAIQIQPSDGLILVAGKFSVFHGANRYGIARLYGDAPVTDCVPCTILDHPRTQPLKPGADITFSVRADGTFPFSYQWRKDGADLLAATNDSHSITNVQSEYAGHYTVVVTNGCGAVTSRVATLTWEPTLQLHRDSTTQTQSLALFFEGQLGGLNIQTSTNLTDWTDLMPLTTPTGNVPLAPSESRRFYRAVFP